MCVTSAPRAQILVNFTLRPAVFETQGFQKIGNIGEWQWTHNSHNYSVYTNTYLQKTKFQNSSQQKADWAKKAHLH